VAFGFRGHVFSDVHIWFNICLSRHISAWHLGENFPVGKSISPYLAGVVLVALTTPFPVHIGWARVSMDVIFHIGLLFFYMCSPVVGVVFPSPPCAGSLARVVVLILCVGEGVCKQVIVYD
jgi:hypothetical protein